METVNLGAADGLPPVNWTDVLGKLDAGSAPAPDAHNARTTWLTTINEDGSPHVTPVGAAWMDGCFWFQTGDGTRKRRNVARDPRCTIAVSIRDADVVVEGDAVAVTDHDAIARIAQVWADQGWPVEPDDAGSGITAPFKAVAHGVVGNESTGVIFSVGAAARQPASSSFVSAPTSLSLAPWLSLA